MPKQEYPGLPQADQQSGAFFAALLASTRTDCDCQTCSILREVADTLIGTFTPKGVSKGGGRKARS